MHERGLSLPKHLFIGVRCACVVSPLVIMTLQPRATSDDHITDMCDMMLWMSSCSRLLEPATKPHLWPLAMGAERLGEGELISGGRSLLPLSSWSST